MKGKTKVFDPSKLTPITPNRRKSEPFDLRYTKSKRFRFSNEAWENLNLDTNGVSMFKYPGGGIVLSVQSEETSQVLKQREGSTQKGREFTSTELAKLLSPTVKEGGEVTDFELNLLSKADDVTYLTIAPFTEKRLTADAPITTDTVTKDVVEETPDETETTSEAQEDTDEKGQDTDDEPEELDSTVFDEDKEEESTEEVPTEDPLEFLKDD